MMIHLTKCKETKFHGQTSGFSLVEVVMAIGIVSFAVVIVVGLFANLMNQRGDVADNRAALLAAQSLPSHLNSGINLSFSDLTNQLSRESFELLYLQYRANETGQPSSTGPRFRSEWLQPSEVTDAHRDAIEGRWVRARIRRASDPGGNTDSASTGRVHVRVELFTVPSDQFAIRENALSASSFEFTVLR